MENVDALLKDICYVVYMWREKARWKQRMSEIHDRLMDGGSELIDALVAALWRKDSFDDSELTVDHHAYDALLMIGEPIVPSLIKVIESDAESRVKSWCVGLLRELDAIEAAPQVATLLTHPSLGLRSFAIGLIVWWRMSQYSDLIALSLESEDESLRNYAQLSLTTIADMEPRYAELLLQMARRLYRLEDWDGLRKHCYKFGKYFDCTESRLYALLAHLHLGNFATVKRRYRFVNKRARDRFPKLVAEIEALMPSITPSRNASRS